MEFGGLCQWTAICMCDSGSSYNDNFIRLTVGLYVFPQIFLKVPMSLTPSSHRSFLGVFHLLVLYFWCLMPCANGSLLIEVAKLADCSGNVVVGTGWVSIASALFGGCVGPSISLCALSWVALSSSFVPDIATYFDRSK
ncbi:hypothetical protein MANES_16G105750v8 [Manihot esculenta]|uniref:Uncharacterized protein n=1 Tax=Manihot esculenta TaxID=3983 RepID=A0ACB7G8L8_MANES|nr:hypothetical protein MANES_16G105750v8 [Manihot esculenta]